MINHRIYVGKYELLETHRRQKLHTHGYEKWDASGQAIHFTIISSRVTHSESVANTFLLAFHRLIYNMSMQPNGLLYFTMRCWLSQLFLLWTKMKIEISRRKIVKVMRFLFDKLSTINKVHNLRGVHGIRYIDLCITPHLPVSSRVVGCEENLYFERWNSDTGTNLANQVKVG